MEKQYFDTRREANKARKDYNKYSNGYNVYKMGTAKRTKRKFFVGTDIEWLNFAR